MQAPEQAFALNSRISSRAVVRASRIIIAISLPILTLLPPAGAKASEDTSAVAETETGNQSREYRLAQGDRLKIVVFNQEQLSGDFMVDGTGGILLPLVGEVKVAGLSLAQAQKLIQDRLADGVLVQPVVSITIPEHRPIFVSGDVRKPGSYPFRFGMSVKAAIAQAGGAGPIAELTLASALFDSITAGQRVRELETKQLLLRVRKARLEAQQHERDYFVMPELVGFNPAPADLKRVYATENDTFLGFAKTFRDQLDTIEKQRPLIGAEIDSLAEQIVKQQERLDIVNDRLADLEPLFKKGLVRKDVLTNQRIERALVQSELSRLEAEGARLRQAVGNLDVRIEEIKANYKRQLLAEFQETSQALQEIEATIGTARKLRDLRARYANVNLYGSEGDRTILVTHAGSTAVSVNANDDAIVEPGDIIEVKLKPSEPANAWSAPAETAQGANSPSLAERRLR